MQHSSDDVNSCCLAVVEVMCTHLGTRQRFGHTPTMKKVIANNLKLTPGQARQLAACYEQFRTIHVTNNAKYMQLANKASDVGFMVAAAAAEKNQASLAAAAASVAGGPAVQQMQPQASRSTGQGSGLSGDQNHSNGSAGVQGASQQPHGEYEQPAGGYMHYCCVFELPARAVSSLGACAC